MSVNIQAKKWSMIGFHVPESAITERVMDVKTGNVLAEGKAVNDYKPPDPNRVAHSDTFSTNWVDVDILFIVYPCLEVSEDVVIFTNEDGLYALRTSRGWLVGMSTSVADVDRFNILMEVLNKWKHDGRVDGTCGLEMHVPVQEQELRVKIK